VESKNQQILRPLKIRDQAESFLEMEIDQDCRICVKKLREIALELRKICMVEQILAFV